jgi:cytochrome c oxidase assembly factor CtaG
MTTGERRSRKSRKTWNLWHVTAFALIPVGTAVAFWSVETQGGTKFRVFMTAAQVLLLLAVLCLMRGYKRKLAAAAARSADGTARPRRRRFGKAGQHPR